MPYIKNEDRFALHERVAKNPGELNYEITGLLETYWFYSKKDYQAINDIMGALEGAKLEFYRRIAVPYEDKKLEENGDVY